MECGLGSPLAKNARYVLTFDFTFTNVLHRERPISPLSSTLRAIRNTTSRTRNTCPVEEETWTAKIQTLRNKPKTPPRHFLLQSNWKFFLGPLRYTSSTFNQVTFCRVRYLRVSLTLPVRLRAIPPSPRQSPLCPYQQLCCATMCSIRSFRWVRTRYGSHCQYLIHHLALAWLRGMNR